MSTPKAKKAVKSLLSKATIKTINKGRAARYEVAVRSAIDCHAAVGDKLSIAIVRSEIRAYDAYYSLSKDVMQRLVNEVKAGNADITSLVEVAEQAQQKANKAKSKSRKKNTGKSKGKGKTGKDAGNTHQDSILELPLPKQYEDIQELLVDYNYLSNWLAVAEKILKKEKLIK